MNRDTGDRVESRYVDAVTGKPVAEADQAKGYEVGDDRFVVLEDEELEAVGSRARGRSISSGSSPAMT